MCVHWETITQKYTKKYQSIPLFSLSDLLTQKEHAKESHDSSSSLLPSAYSHHSQSGMAAISSPQSRWLHMTVQWKPQRLDLYTQTWRRSVWKQRSPWNPTNTLGAIDYFVGGRKITFIWGCNPEKLPIL